jgi:hypothetical protein
LATGAAGAAAIFSRVALRNASPILAFFLGAATAGAGACAGAGDAFTGTGAGAGTDAATDDDLATSGASCAGIDAFFALISSLFAVVVAPPPTLIASNCWIKSTDLPFAFNP